MHTNEQTSIHEGLSLLEGCLFTCVWYLYFRITETEAECLFSVVIWIWDIWFLRSVLRFFFFFQLRSLLDMVAYQGNHTKQHHAALKVDAIVSNPTHQYMTCDPPKNGALVPQENPDWSLQKAPAVAGDIDCFCLGLISLRVLWSSMYLLPPRSLLLKMVQRGARPSNRLALI